MDTLCAFSNAKFTMYRCRPYSTVCLVASNLVMRGCWPGSGLTVNSKDAVATQNDTKRKETVRPLPGIAINDAGTGHRNGGEARRYAARRPFKVIAGFGWRLAGPRRQGAAQLFAGGKVRDFPRCRRAPPTFAACLWQILSGGGRETARPQA